MKTRKYLAMILVVVMLAAAFAGCGQTAAPVEPAPAPVPAPVPTEAAADDVVSDDGAIAGGVPQPDGFPSKTINWIIPVAAGATVDIPCRGLVDVLDLGESVVIENIAGASQTVGTTEASIRDADGHTLLTMANASGIIQPIINDVAYSVDDFRNIAMITPTLPTVLAVRADSPIQTLDDWFALLESGERYSYGIPSAGGIGHLALYTTLKALGHEGDPNATMAVYNGGAENITALLSGEVDFTIPDASDAISRVNNGEMRVLAIMSDEPCHLFPDVPVMTDYGVEGIGTFVSLKWIAVRADTPDEIVEWLKQEINKAIQTQEYQEYLHTQGYDSMREYTEEEIDEILATARKDYEVALKALGLAG